MGRLSPVGREDATDGAANCPRKGSVGSIGKIPVATLEKTWVGVSPGLEMEHLAPSAGRGCPPAAPSCIKPAIGCTDVVPGTTGLYVLGVRRSLARCRPGVPQWVQSQGCLDSRCRRKAGECPWVSRAAKVGRTLQSVGQSLECLPLPLCLFLHWPQLRQAKADPVTVGTWGREAEGGRQGTRF